MSLTTYSLTEKQRELCDEIQKYEEGTRQKAKDISELQAKLTKYEGRGRCSAIEERNY